MSNKRTLIGGTMDSTNAEESQDPWKGERTACSITIYAGSDCSITDMFRVTKVPRQKGGFLSRLSLYPSRPSRTSNNGEKFVAVVEGLPETIKTGTLILRVPQNQDQVTVTDYEIYVPNTLNKIAEIFQEKMVEILDLSVPFGDTGIRTKSKTPISGILQNKNDNIIELRDASGMSTYMELPREFSIKVTEPSAFDVIHPYALCTLKASSTFLNSNAAINMVMTYGAFGISYEVAHTFTLSSNSKMEIITTANITNNTSVTFVGAFITIVENANRRILSDADFENSRYNAVQQQQYNIIDQVQTRESAQTMSYSKVAAAPKAYRTSSRAVISGTSPTSSFEDLSEATSTPLGGGSDSGNADEKQEQKTFSIPESIILEPRTTKTMVMQHVPNVNCQLQYIYNPHIDPSAVGMSLFWENSSQNNSLLGKLLPHGLATVYNERTLPNGFVTQTKLGEAYISNEHSKPFVRMSLGVANMIQPSFSSSGSQEFKDQGIRKTTHQIEIKNKMVDPISVLIRFRFDRAGWRVDSKAIQFEEWGPENRGDPPFKAVGKAVVQIPAATTKKFVFTANYDIE